VGIARLVLVLASLALAIGPVVAQATRAPLKGGIPGGSIGASDYQSLGDPRVDPKAFGAALAGLGVTFTRVWLVDAWATGTGEPGSYDGVLPATRRADGRWDLFTWNEPYFERLRAFAAAMNGHGITPVFTLLELYSWSASKQGLLWVPDQRRGLFQANVNGVRWGHPDAPTLAALPDAWLRAFACRVVDALGTAVFVIELGNEMPDAAMHDRLATHLRSACGYDGEILVNRDSNGPDVFDEMAIGRRYDRLSIHGASDLGYLDARHAGAGPNRTIRALYDSGIDMARIIVSSDGARATTDVERAYDYAALREVAADVLRRGGSYEHQLAIKLRRFRDGRYTLDDLRYDADFLRAIAAIRR
jgi:hypothetical protein